MTGTDGREIAVALYDRLSTKCQDEVGYAEEGHLHELRERLAKMIPPRRIVEEVPDDPGEKRWMQDRPGVRRLKELARAGRVGRGGLGVELGALRPEPRTRGPEPGA